MRIGELARAAGVSPRAVRYYEQLGLLRPAERSEGGYRIYCDAALTRLRKINQLKELGLSLEDIQSVLDLYFTDPSGVSGKRAALARLHDHLRKAQQRRRELHALETELTANITRLTALLRRAEAGEFLPASGAADGADHGPANGADHEPADGAGHGKDPQDAC